MLCLPLCKQSNAAALDKKPGVFDKMAAEWSQKELENSQTESRSYMMEIYMLETESQDHLIDDCLQGEQNPLRCFLTCPITADHNLQAFEERKI